MQKPGLGQRVSDGGIELAQFAHAQYHMQVCSRQTVNSQSLAVAYPE